MGQDTAVQILQKFSDECIDCGCCLQACSLLDDLGQTPAEIARQILDGQVDEAVIKTIQRCALCGLCSQSCLVNLKPAQAMSAARESLILAGLIELTDYQVMQVDNDWHFFTIYRNMWGINYDDLQVDTYDTLFFPGCTLASYSPALTRLAHNWLQEQGFTVGITDRCCGIPLSSIGLSARNDRLLAELRADMAAAGAHRLVTTCPNCYYHLQKHLDDIEVISLYQMMAEAGIQISGPSTLTIHDSCLDRHTVQIGQEMRQLLAGYPLVEMEHHGQNSICCGSGGIVSMIDPELCRERAQTRLAEFHDTGATYCVTACMGCAKRLGPASPTGAGHLDQNLNGRTRPESTSIPSQHQVIHLLELIFDAPVDHDQVQAQITAMWQGDWGEYNLHLLSQARIATATEETDV